MATLHALPTRPLPHPLTLLPTRPTRPIRHQPPRLAHAGLDPLEQMARDDREDWALLRLVLCVAVATVLMAVASSFVG
ncbi:MAG: hypothetical protein H6932_05255 [Burkholderiaceae bacterium]|nr:hypothetical protein [Burkholderiaceae bacterium]